ncbi:putative transcriptional regulatory protein PB24D3.01 [Fusarium austroafricanum]|uniref:Putative transcriptional regulatory protein PB24D3.01 n=1 Tax=Fusarium austroafricanum TaxID=2364996 RepID=A0A8H4NZ91_9HYPO|nr:putative transcriptional regulatory protein PB24D3.01 [Fusarium austroafricanum]
MPNPRSVRSSQRSVLACTNCSRRKIRCSKTIPCTACVRQNKAAQCRREPVAVVTRRSTARSRASTLPEDPVPAPETNNSTTNLQTPVNHVTPTAASATLTAPSTNDALPQINDEILQQLLASISTSETRLTNEAASALEFLTHGRRNILNQFIGRDAATSSADQPAQKWDTFLPAEDARALLVLHQRHLTWMHNVVHMSTFIEEFDQNVFKLECDQSWIALYYAVLSAEFMDKHKLTSVQTISLLVQVAYNFDKSDLICVLVSTGIRIAQCLNLHRLGPEHPEHAASGNSAETIDREIPFQNTCQIHPTQFNTPMPGNCHNVERMIKDGIIAVQPAEACTGNTWTNCLHQLAVLMWKHQDRISTTSNAETYGGDVIERYGKVIQADEEIKSLYLSWPMQLRDVNAVPDEEPVTDGIPTQLMPAMLLMSTAQKIFTVHRQFQLSCFRDRRFAFSQLSCVTIAERSIEAFQRWPDCLETRICRRMWTTLSYVISCSITLLFALLFNAQNALTHDLERIRGYVEFGRDLLSHEENRSSIARRGVRLLGALMDLERSSDFSVDVEADIGDTIRRVALADEDGVEVNPAEGYQIVFPYGQDLWESLMREPLEDAMVTGGLGS